MKFFSHLYHVQVVAYFLVIYRVTTGQGWTKETERQLTTLQFNRGAQITFTDDVNGAQSKVPAITTMKAIASPPISHFESAA